MLHFIHRPTFPLSRFIENFWMVNCEGTLFGRERIFPDGAIELIFNLGSPQKLLHNDNPHRFTHYKKSWISGERKSFITVDITPDYYGIGIRFRPGGAFPFLKIPLSELTDQVVEMDSIWGNWINEVRDQLGEAATPSLKFKILEDILLKKANGALERPPIIDAALTRLLNLEDGLSIKTLASDLGVSQKHLIRLFDRVVGLTPKMLARILKFQKVLQCVEQSASSNENLSRNGASRRVHWTQIAYECGYYDQAHMIRDFQNFTGMTPTAYFAQRSPYLNYVFD